MSNIKAVDIQGKMPFNVYENKDATYWLGVMNSPSYGLRIEYGKSGYLTNSNSGKTSYTDFSIVGEEAIREDSIEKMVSNFIEAGAEIRLALYRDIELDTPWYGVQFHNKISLTDGKIEKLRDMGSYSLPA